MAGERGSPDPPGPHSRFLRTATSPFFKQRQMSVK